jgi:hypothetical protein
MLNKVIEQITREGIKAKDFRSILNDYHMSIREVAKININ